MLTRGLPRFSWESTRAPSAPHPKLVLADGGPFAKDHWRARSATPRQPTSLARWLSLKRLTRECIRFHNPVDCDS